ncbi:MAG: DNA polymerase, partial [Actinomycetota bacterium]|nr:DNA polymerase [Actinomycetota bacterium]
MAEITFIYLPVGQHGADQGVDEYLVSGRTVDDLLALRTSELRDPPEGDADGPDGPDTQSAVLVRFGEEADLFHSPDGEAYATLETEGHRETHAIKSRDFKLWLKHRFYERFGKPPGSQALKDALEVLEAEALFEGEEHPVHIRVAEHDGAIYVDLVNNAWKAVQITPEGFKLVSDPPVRFRRRKGMLALPNPIEGGKVDALRRFVNVRDEAAWRLLLAWLVQAFRPTGPYPILILQGEQGSAKTTLARILKAIVDPSTAPVRSAPRGEHDLVIAATNSWVLSLDNLSGLPPWLSDALCRLSTGGGFGTRTLYENDEETIFYATRPALLNGITDVATRADLLDRSIILVLHTILEGDRRPEAEIWREFQEALPGILGGIFEAVSTALRNLPETTLPRLPRMADFALFATAAEESLGMEPGGFMATYDESRREISQLALEADPVAVAVVKLMEGKEEWVGTAAELLKALRKRVDDDVRCYKTFPKQPQHLSRHLKRLAPVLRAEGVEMEDLPRQGSERKKRLFKKKPGNDRHDRHDRHGDPEAHTDADSEGDGGDDGVTVTTDEGSGDRHPEKPVKEPKTTSDDGDDDRDDEMRPFSKGVPLATQEGPYPPDPEGYTLITEQDRLKEMISDLEGSAKVGLDLETTSLRWWEDKIRLLSITTESGRTWLVDAFQVDITSLFPALRKTKMIAHNAQFDLLFLRRAGFEPKECSCTMILSQILGAGKGENDKFHGLGDVVGRVLRKDMDKDQQKAGWDGELSPGMLGYAAADSRILLPLHEGLSRLIDEAGGMGRIVALEERLLKAVVRMADVGVPIDMEVWAGYVGLIREEKERLVGEMDAHVSAPLPEAFAERNAKNKSVPEERNGKVNWQGGEQRAWALETLGFDLPLTEKGKPSTGKDALKGIDHPLARAMERFNAISNVAKTFGEALEDRIEGDRLHCDWRQNEAATGRMSCRKPPLQGVPSEGELRRAIRAPLGRKLVVSDLSQIEVRVLAALSGDEALREAFEKELDIHRSVAQAILGREEVTSEERKIAKAIVFGNMYGQGVEGMRRRVENSLGRRFTWEEAEAYWESFFDAYPEVKRWREKISLEFDLGERETRTRTGRRRIEVDEKPKRWNAPIQGLAADALKAITAEVHERREEIPGLELVALVHDEV